LRDWTNSTAKTTATRGEEANSAAKGWDPFATNFPKTARDNDCLQYQQNAGLNNSGAPPEEV